MREIELSILKSSVLADIGRETSYIGVKNVDGNGEPMYDQVYLKLSDQQYLNAAFEKAVNNLRVVYGYNLKSLEMKDANTQAVFTIHMPDNFPKSQDNALQKIAYNFVLNQLLAEWFELTDKEKVETYASQAKALLMQLNQMIYLRNRPTRNFI